MPRTGRDGLSSGCHTVTLTPSHLSDCPSFSLQGFTPPARWEQSVTQRVWTVEYLKQLCVCVCVCVCVCAHSLPASPPPHHRSCSLLLLRNILWLLKNVLAGEAAVHFMAVLNELYFFFQSFSLPFSLFAYISTDVKMKLSHLINAEQENTVWSSLLLHC